MNGKPTATAAPPGMSLDDILYVLFRHKGKIVLGSLLGVVAFFALPYVKPHQYQSEAKLYVSYVVDTKAPTSAGETVQSTSAGDSVINTELEILLSRDLAQQVAEDLGAKEILAKAGGGTNVLAAAALIQKGLTAETVPHASVIRLTFKHPDPAIVQPVLNRLTSFYFIKHNEVHSPAAIDDFLTQETDLLRSRLDASQDALRKAKAKVGVVVLNDDKKTYSAQIGKIQERIMDAEADLAARRAELNVIANLFSSNPTAPAVTNAPAPPPAPVPAEVVTRYRGTCGLLSSLRAREQQLLMTFTPESSFIKEAQSQIDANEKAKRQLEKDYPGLTAVNTFEPRAGGTESPAGPQNDLIAAKAGVASLEAKIATLNQQLARLSKHATVVDEAEDSIMDLERKKDFDESYYKQFLEKLAQVQLDKKASAEQVSIRPVQLPSPPAPAPSKLDKLKPVIPFGGLAFGVALAFLIELYLDQSFRRPREIETSFPMRLFITIPRLKLNGKPNRVQISGGIVRRSLLPERTNVNASDSQAPHGSGGPAAENSGNGTSKHSLEIASWNPAHVIRPFCDGLRDRLITYFENNNLTHKPKLVTVTSCHSGSGVSTVAAGLAASLSETGEGNVLLVDMNVNNGEAHHFYKGDLACGIDDALEKQTREGALVQDNLYVVSETANRDKLPAVLPTRFKHLVPRLKASDFDYIIFDMPPISQVSITPRLARFMDMVLLVVESEKTGRDVVKRAVSFLGESKTSVSIVLNKRRFYVPARFRQEF